MLRTSDTSNTPALIASEGPTGIENSVAYNAQLDLGNQALQAGPNAGTLVRAGEAAGRATADRVGDARPLLVTEHQAVHVESLPLPQPAGASRAARSLRAP